MAEEEVRHTGIYEGNLPVRVLQHNTLGDLFTANDLAKKYLKEMIDSGELKPEIEYDAFPAPVNTPWVDCIERTIHVQETFLAALWASSYGLMVIHDSVARSYMSEVAASHLDTSDPSVQDALNLLDYSVRLFSEYSEWPSELPNPEFYTLSKKEFVEKANNLFVTASAFAIAHEVGHVYLKHCDEENWDLFRQKPSNLTPKEISLRIEYENDADRFAVEHFLLGQNDNSNKTVRLFGILVTNLCLLLGCQNATELVSFTHPDLDKRIANVLSGYVEDNEFRDTLYGVTNLALNIFLSRQGHYASDVAYDTAQDLLDHYIDLLDTLKGKPGGSH